MNEESSQYAKSYLLDLAEIKINEDNFYKEIDLYSRYLSYTNSSYQYNETYLKSFCNEFLEFKKYVQVKKCIFDKIISIVWGKNFDISIGLDDLWQYKYFYNNGNQYDNYEINKNTDIKKFCSEDIYLKCIVNNKKSKFIFMKNINLFNSKDLKDLLKQLDDFLIDKSVDGV